MEKNKTVRIYYLNRDNVLEAMSNIESPCFNFRGLAKKSGISYSYIRTLSQITKPEGCSIGTAQKIYGVFKRTHDFDYFFRRKDGKEQK